MNRIESDALATGPGPEPTAIRARAPDDALVSVVVPAYNERANLPVLYERVRDALEGAGYRFDLLIVDDGGTDGSLETLRELHARDERVGYLSLSRNFGHQGALIAGIEHARGDVVVTLDGDLQHPPELLPEMLELWVDGYDVVNTRKARDSTRSLARQAIDTTYYRLLGKWSGLEVSGSDFRLMDRTVVDALCRLPEHQKLIRGLVTWLGFRQHVMPYQVAHRLHGEAKYRLSHLVKLAADGIFSFSTRPLRLLSMFGLLVAIPSLLYMIVIVALGAWALFTNDFAGLPPGWATLAVAVTFFGGVHLIAFGLLGEYIGRIYLEAKGRPPYIVMERSPAAASVKAPVDASVKAPGDASVDTSTAGNG